jgi:chemotaxis protein methyltransferase CheR
MSGTDKMNITEYQRFKVFLEKACGILLGDGKQYLIESRLTRLFREEKIASMAELLSLIESPSEGRLRDKIIDAMTTNETSWFRDQNPFEVLQEVIFPELDKQNKRGVRVWSAACSSGQEPYTISIALSEYLSLTAQNTLQQMQIMATDISPSMLEQAKLAQYDETVLGRGLTARRKQAYFTAVDEEWMVKDEIKRRVNFREQNLLANYNNLGKFDIIFCRNVLIYFSSERKSDILKRMAAILNPGGYLFLGASETTMAYSDKFDMIRSPAGVFFRLKTTA